MAEELDQKLTGLETNYDKLSDELTALQLRILNATMVLNAYEVVQSSAVKVDHERLSVKELQEALPTVSYSDR